ncbi:MULTISPECIES: ATP-dependent helicase [Rhizobium/Agrobacterium group]|uniref:ATP-dependent helicase n=1 Tax=Rhizobium/Agrobacterium group TaxID=227290 RepID=UPI000B406D1A|nr:MULTISPECIES: UvrD-helicase domain-containing protein [Rhizobium/Agrobacterium group]MCF1484464.1 AAA family ATPase [Allorhizobium ampelinum]NSZ43229.1 UvrD-helicase domain-containing protein [Agrobacterium vitis]NTA26886.1 UvrD-helicase domain-containing protein [Allorhizobium ampelinum]OVE94704.1 ATP-dependent DNA helicase [Allorhizobium ampelinum]
MSNGFDDIPFFDEEPAPRTSAKGAKATDAPAPQQESSPAASTKAGGGLGIAARAMAARDQNRNPDYLAGLNPEQREAVETLDGPVLVLAGAGTGKTRVLTTRIAHILATGRAFPSQILSVTFTNKAAREMKERVGVLVGGAVEGMPWLGTFHSIGVKLLRRHAELVGLTSDFTILDTDDVVRLIKQIIQAEGLDDKRWPAKMFAGMIDGWKNKGLDPAQIPEGDARAFGNGKGRELYAAYQARLKSLNACDFGDLLLHPIRMFRANPDVLKDYHQRFRFILVDEYQDTNTAQYMWLRLLAQRPSTKTADGKVTNGTVNICCVGDDDQSIYGWRGAEVDNILRFEKDFPGAKVIKLERNYRSTEHILGAAGFLIAHNEGRLGKTLFTDRVDPNDEKVVVHAAWDSEEEARAVGEEIEQLQRNQHKLNDMAILVRASFQMREFEDRFVTLGLNYRVIGGPRFYERLEIRDAMAYFRMVCQPADDLAFERIVNTPKRGLGDTTVRTLHDYARKRDIPMLAAASDIIETDELKPKARKALFDVVTDFRRWQDLLENTPHTELAEQILDESGYTAMWQNDKSAEAPGRLENLKELIRSMEAFESMRSFMEHVSLVMDAETNENLDAVSIMTLHSAKGLEFETVFLPGWEEGLFPHQRALDEGGRAALEEERRLAYVGLTRAKRRCHLWFVSNRRIHGLWQSTMPSRFLDELPPAHVEVAEVETSYGGYGRGGYGQSRFDKQEPFTNSYSTPGWKRAQANKTDATRENWGSRSGHAVERIGYGESGPRGQTIDGQLVAKSTSNEPSKFSVGDRVFHIKFGNGNVSVVEGNKLTIDFDRAGQKRVLDGFVERA